MQREAVGDGLRVRLAHVSVGCNVVGHAADWAANGLIAYGAHHAVAIFDPQATRIVTTLAGHGARVNAVAWLPPPAVADDAALAAPQGLVSGAADGSVLVWCPPPNDAPAAGWWAAHKLLGPGGPITCVCAAHAAPGAPLHVVACAGDGYLHAWRLPAAAPGIAGSPPPAIITLPPSQSLPHAGRSGAHSCAVMVMPSTALSSPLVILASGQLDGTVILYTQGGDDRPQSMVWSLACSLPGHGDRVTSLALAPAGACDPSAAMLASSSTDRRVRVWAVRPVSGMEQPSPLSRLASGPEFCAAGVHHTCTLESVLAGHDDWVHSVQWAPRGASGGECDEPPRLLTSGMDRAVMVWARPAAAAGVWLSAAAFGAAGGATLGFYGAVWGPGGTAVAAHGHTGALHLWRMRGADAGWAPSLCTCGHTSAVTDLTWGGPGGSYLLSVSSDATARLLAPWVGRDTWHEVSRPQVHGHGLTCVTTLGQGGREYASGADEKVLRLFEVPDAVVATLGAVADVTLCPAPVGGHPGARRVVGASLPALGLSNKALFEPGQQQGEAACDDAAHVAAACRPAPGGDDDGEGGPTGADWEESLPMASPLAMTSPPGEDHLAQSTLWPETRKLYGHGDDLTAVAATPDGRLLATACKAQGAAWARILLWAPSSGRPLGALPAHNLTVTALAFSPDAGGRYLLSASRDRLVGLHRLEGGIDSGDGHPPTASPPVDLLTPWGPYTRVALASGHARVVYALAWRPGESAVCASGARDGRILLWHASDAALVALGRLPTLPMACTALAWDASDLLAAGLSDGSIRVYRLPPTLDAASLAALPPSVVLQPGLSHVAAVRRMQWRPGGGGGDKPRLLATAGEDHAVRLLEVTQDS